MSTTTITASVNYTIASNTTVKNTTASNQKSIIAIRLEQTIKVLWNRFSGVELDEYVLALFFYRFLSENLTFYLNRTFLKEKLKEKYNRDFDDAEISDLMVDGLSVVWDFDYRRMSDIKANERKQQTIEKKNFFIEPELLFEHILKYAKWDSLYVPETIIERKYDVTAREHTAFGGTQAFQKEPKPKPPLNLVDLSLIIHAIFTEIHKSFFGWLFNLGQITEQEKYKIHDRWRNLVEPIWYNFQQLGDTVRYQGCFTEKRISSLLKTIKKKNEKLIEIMDAIDTIPLNDFIIETYNYNMLEIIELLEEIKAKLFKQ